MDPYLTLKWLHILSSTVLFGTGMGTAFQMVWAWRTGRVETIHSVASGVVIADWIFTTPAGFIHAVFFYVRYAVSYRDLEKIMAERGVQIDHATLNRWVVKYSPDIAKAAQTRKQTTAGSWRMDETYIKVKGKWMYLYRAVDKYGKTLNFMLSRRRDKAAARLFFRRAIETNGLPSRIVIDKSGANLAGLQRINVGLKFSRTKQRIEILRVKYLNNIVEQDHRFIKKITRPTLGFKTFHTAAATLAGIEVAHMIQKTTISNKPHVAVQTICQLGGLTLANSTEPASGKFCDRTLFLAQ
jgi:putative transposase